MSPEVGRWWTNIAITMAVVVLMGSIWIASGRTVESDGLGYDGEVYAEMTTQALYLGGDNARMRPLVILLNQVMYDAALPDVIRTFQVMNFVYGALLALVLAGILDVYGVSTAHKLLFLVNVFATIAVTKMFTFYPVLVDLGAYFFVTLAVFAILRGGRAGIVVATLLAVMAREFGLVVVLFGIHREIRQRKPWLRTAATYAPAIVGFVALRQWVLATSLRPNLTGLEGGLLSGADVVSNVAALLNPMFLLFLAYFTLTVFGGVSLLIALRALRGRLGLNGETEWLTYAGLVGLLTVAGNADLWRYLAYALPAAAVLYAKALASEDWRIIAPWTLLVTLFTQQPWVRMTDTSYFEEWFPLYLPQFGVPEFPTPEFWIRWSLRMAVLTLIGAAAWAASRPQVADSVRDNIQRQAV